MLAMPKLSYSLTYTKICRFEAIVQSNFTEHSRLHAFQYKFSKFSLSHCSFMLHQHIYTLKYRVSCGVGGD